MIVDLEDGYRKFGFIYVTVAPQDSSFVVGWFMGDEPVQIEKTHEPIVLIRRLVADCPFEICYVVYSPSVASHPHHEAQDIVTRGTHTQDLASLRLSRADHDRAVSLFNRVDTFLYEEDQSEDRSIVDEETNDRNERVFAIRRRRFLWALYSFLVFVGSISFAGYILGASADGIVVESEYWMAAPLVGMLFGTSVRHGKVIWAYLVQVSHQKQSGERGHLHGRLEMSRVRWSSNDVTAVNATI